MEIQEKITAQDMMKMSPDKRRETIKELFSLVNTALHDLIEAKAALILVEAIEEAKCKQSVLWEDQK